MQILKNQPVTQQNWWLLAIRAIVAIIFGIAIIAWPKLTLTVFIYLFGAFVVLDGIFAIGLALSRRKDYVGWWAILLGGLFGIVVGILTFVYPQVSGLFLVYLVATWAILIGIFELVNAFSPDRSTAQRWISALTGLLALLLGVLLFVRPGSGILSVVWLIGAFSIVYGVLLLIRVMFPGKAVDTSSEGLERVE